MILYLVRLEAIEEGPIADARGYNWATLFLAELNTGTCPPPRLGESKKIETLKYAHERSALEMPSKNGKIQT
jgi:hypothetical protein